MSTISIKNFIHNNTLIATISCTFRGRLDQGKGADLLCDALGIFLLGSLDHDWEFHIIGTGKYYDQLVSLSIEYPQIRLYGRSTWEQIHKIAKSGHYCLCPSTFLETFGMTALEGCKLGLPVIGPSKGGLQQFVLPQIGALRTQDTSESIIDQLRYIDTHHDQHYSQRKSQTLEIAIQFGPDIRATQVNKLL